MLKFKTWTGVQVPNLYLDDNTPVGPEVRIVSTVKRDPETLSFLQNKDGLFFFHNWDGLLSASGFFVDRP